MSSKSRGVKVVPADWRTPEVRLEIGVLTTGKVGVLLAPRPPPVPSPSDPPTTTGPMFQAGTRWALPLFGK